MVVLKEDSKNKDLVSSVANAIKIISKMHFLISCIDHGIDEDVVPHG